MEDCPSAATYSVARWGEAEQAEGLLRVTAIQARHQKPTTETSQRRTNALLVEARVVG